MTTVPRYPFDYRWETRPEAAALVHDLLTRFRDASPWIQGLGQRLRDETGTRLVDWVDHFSFPLDETLSHNLHVAGFRPLETNASVHWRHGGGLFPEVYVGAAGRPRLFLKVESVADFLFAHRMAKQPIQGAPLAAVRRSLISAADDVECWVIERHGAPATSDDVISAEAAQAVLHHAEAFRRRERSFDRPEEGFADARRLIAAAQADLGVPRTCDLFFAAERAYWQSRNRAARVQKQRQDALGLGWGNHDHHTYRSSRESFADLIAVLELLGCHCRERFYAGQSAGWGAQVLEQPDCGVVIFADVDLADEEVAGDFAHQGLPPRQEFGTVGLWCRLHGEAILEAGLHHLECQFDFDAARDQLRAEGVETMKPFTDLPHLRQAFTRGEMWPVSSQRIDVLLADGQITKEQAEIFRAHGAIGSHLEILQRDEGYKGFNQSGIDEIILDTDPRKTAAL